MQVGDKIDIERGDGSHVVFEVVNTETVPVADVNMSKLLVSANTAREGLNIITCGGDYNSNDFHFADRTIVYALKI